MQLILFADHSLKHFPGVAEGIRELNGDPRTEVIVLLPRPNRAAESILPLLGLGGVPVVAASPRLYALYNVRVTPWLMAVSSRGVMASSLVNHGWQVGRLPKLADIRLQDALRPGELPAGGGVR